VLCVDEKSQIQALDRTQPILPVRPGLPERRTHDYIRHGTTTLFAALEVETGKVIDACMPRHRHQEFLRFLKQGHDVTETVSRTLRRHAGQARGDLANECVPPLVLGGLGQRLRWPAGLGKATARRRRRQLRHSCWCG
jgi:hypothetical protein